jgi:hypothetical protein
MELVGAVETRVQGIKVFALNSAKQLNERIESELVQFTSKSLFDNDALKPEIKARREEPKPDWLEDVVKTLERRLEEISIRLSKVTADTDESAIRFAGLGFRSSREANVWLMLSMPEHNCGLVVDVHMVMEHVHASITRLDSISRLEKLLKLKIKTLADGLAMTSFETKVPRYFSQAATHKVVKQDGSYFDTIATFDDRVGPS